MKWFTAAVVDALAAAAQILASDVHGGPAQGTAAAVVMSDITGPPAGAKIASGSLCSRDR